MKINQGDIWVINLEPTVGNEIQKTRPCVVISNSKLSNYNTFIIAPITDLNENKKNNNLIYYSLKNWKQYNLEKPSAVNCFQIRAIDSKRLVKKLGVIDKFELKEITVRTSVIIKSE